MIRPKSENSFYGKTSQLAHSETQDIAPQPLLHPQDIDRNYITGLCEAACSFTYSRSNNSINLRFGIKLGEKDKFLIFALKAYFGVGHIYKSGNPEAWYYCVSRMDEIPQVIAHFDKHPFLGRKAASYAIWKEMFHLKKVPRKFDFVALNTLAERLSSLSPKGRRYIK